MPPRVTVVLPRVEELLLRKLLGKVAETEAILAFCNWTFPRVVAVLPSPMLVFPMVILPLVTAVLEMIIATFVAVVTRPLASTVTWLTVLALP